MLVTTGHGSPAWSSPCLGTAWATGHGEVSTAELNFKHDLRDDLWCSGTLLGLEGGKPGASRAWKTSERPVLQFLN